jgi:hypothetical protein
MRRFIMHVPEGATEWRVYNAEGGVRQGATAFTPQPIPHENAYIFMRISVEHFHFETVVQRRSIVAVFIRSSSDLI